MEQRSGLNLSSPFRFKAGDRAKGGLSCGDRALVLSSGEWTLFMDIVDRLYILVVFRGLECYFL